MAMFGLVIGGAEAQKKKKPSLTKIETTVDNAATNEIAVEDLVAVKEMADDAIVYEKTMGKTRTWYLHAMVYKLIYDKGEEVAGVSTIDALTTVGTSLAKAAELGKETDIYTIKANQVSENLWGELLNNGVNAYNEQNLAEAVKAFELTTLIKPQDTTGYLYAGAAASDLKDYDAAVRNYKNLVKINPQESYYSALISIQKDGMKDFDGAQATIDEAKEALGDNQTINKYEIDLLIQTDQVSKAITKIDEAVTAEPSNAILHLKRGLLFDQLASAERKSESPDLAKLENYVTEARASYDKTIELDPQNLTAYFNYSIIYNDMANKLYNELNAMGIKEYQKNKKKYETDAKVYLEKALPYMEKAYGIDGDDADILYALESFYSRLNKKDKLAEVQAKMKSLGLIDE